MMVLCPSRQEHGESNRHLRVHAMLNAEVRPVEEQRRLQHRVDEEGVDQHEVARL